MKPITTADSRGKARTIDAVTFCTLAGPPVIFFLAANYLETLLGDFPSDPDYPYLFNGVNIAQLAPPAQFDHPGTAIQIVIALVSILVHGVRAAFQNQSFVDDVLLHPELYLRSVSVTLMVATALALFALGWRVHRASGSLPIALVAQGSIFLTAPAWMLGVTSVGPEALLVPLAIALAALVAPIALSQERPTHNAGLALSAGVVLGACAATKTTAFPLALTVLLLHGRKYQLLACGVAIAAAVVITLPIRHKYGFLIGYNLDILTHTGRWGSGEAGLPTFTQYWASLRALYDIAPEMFISVALCAVLAAFSSWQILRHRQSGLLRLFLVSGGGMLAQLAVVAKHPGPHYLIPAVGFLCLANCGISFALLRSGGWRRMAGAIVVLALVAHGLLHGGHYAIRYITNSAAQRRDNRALETAYANAGCRVVYAYESQSVPYKTWWGDQFGGGARTAFQPLSRCHHLS